MIEFIGNLILGVIFGNLIHNIIVIVILIGIVTVGFGIIHQEMVNPSLFDLSTSQGVSNVVTNMTNYLTLGISILPTLIFGGAGSSFGAGIGKAIRKFQERNDPSW